MLVSVSGLEGGGALLVSMAMGDDSVEGNKGEKRFVALVSVVLLVSSVWEKKLHYQHITKRIARLYIVSARLGRNGATVEPKVLLPIGDSRS